MFLFDMDVVIKCPSDQKMIKDNRNGSVLFSGSRSSGR